MGLHELGIKIATALPDQQKIPSGRGTTLLGDIIPEGHPRNSAYIKIQSIENIAKEALCAVLARSIKLPVQQPFYINMLHTEFAGQGNVENIAFGLLNDRMPASRIVSLQGIEGKLAKWPDLLKAAVFDEWIANRNRIPNNIVYERGDLFWLYDHDDAFPDSVTPSTAINSQLLALASQGKSEFELFKLRNDSMKIIEELHTIDWHQIFERLNVKILKSAIRYFDKYIHFLKQRLPELRTIISQDLQIKQSEFTFTRSEQPNAEITS